MTRHAAIAKHIRHRINVAGIKARVIAKEGIKTSVGSRYYISVVTPSFESRFTPDEIKTFCTIAEINRLTFVCGEPVDPDKESRLTGKNQWDFYIPAEKMAQ